jgi:hypothetical protein
MKHKNVLCTVLCMIAAAMLTRAQVPGTAPVQKQSESTLTAPVEPIPAILEAFRSHAIVALGNVEGGNEQSHQFQLSLIRDPRFAVAVNDILVEFGNARYQEVLDRFERGDDPMNRCVAFGAIQPRSNTSGTCRCMRSSSGQSAR